MSDVPTAVQSKAPTQTASPRTLPTAIRQLSTAVNQFVPQARYQIARLGPAGLTGGAAASAALIIGAFALFSLRAANDHLITEITQAQQHRSRPVVTPEQGLIKVVAQLPTRSQMPVVIGQVVQQARAAGVELTKGQYSYARAAAGAGAGAGLGRYELDFPVTASYPGVRDFINNTLTHVPSAGLFKLSIERKAIGDGEVNADVRFVVFVRDR